MGGGLEGVGDWEGVGVGWEGDWEGVGVGGDWEGVGVGGGLTSVSHLQPHHHTQQIPSPVLLSDPPKKVRVQPSSARYAASP